MTEDDRQEYRARPVSVDEVRGLSSKTIYSFMTRPFPDDDDHQRTDHPLDVDDWERNRALLLQYPEWRGRLAEMSRLSNTWANLARRWDLIERLYNENDYSACYAILQLCQREQ